eukprot:4468911-Heterocapsa_arctica.AAC.1
MTRSFLPPRGTHGACSVTPEKNRCTYAARTPVAPVQKTCSMLRPMPFSVLMSGRIYWDGKGRSHVARGCRKVEVTPWESGHPSARTAKSWGGS